MKKKHFDDLTKIDCPFGMLTEDTQKRLKTCNNAQRFDRTKWVEVNAFPVFDLNCTYRQKPEPRAVTVHIYEVRGTLFANSDSQVRRDLADKLIATREIVIEEDEG